MEERLKREREMEVMKDGMLVGGIPVGNEWFIRQSLEEKKNEIIEDANKVFEKFTFSHHYNWSMLYYSTRTRADYWLRHVYPSLTREFAEEIQEYLEKLFFGIMEIEPNTFEEKEIRMQLPLKLLGTGMENLVSKRNRAFLGASASAMAALLSYTVDGVRQEGHVDIEVIRNLLGPQSFEPGNEKPWGCARENRGMSNQLDETCKAYEAVYGEMRSANVGRGKTMAEWAEGPIQPYMAAADNVEKMWGGFDRMMFRVEEDEESGKVRHQHQITKQLNVMLWEWLMKKAKAMARGNPLKMALLNHDKGMSHQVFSSLPFQGNWLNNEEFRVVAQLKYAAPQSCLRTLLGQPIARSKERVDRYGFKLACENKIPGNERLIRHSVMELLIAKDAVDANLYMEVEPANLFSTVVNANINEEMRADLTGGNGWEEKRNMRSIIPDFVHQMPDSENSGVMVDVLSDVKYMCPGGAMYRHQGNGKKAVETKDKATGNAYLVNSQKADKKYNQEELLQIEEGGWGPIEKKVRGYVKIRSLVFGAYGEVSQDVEVMMKWIAENMAEKVWILNGQDSPMAAKSRAMQVIRARWAAEAARGQARLILGRRQYVGPSPGKRINVAIQDTLMAQMENNVYRQYG